MKTRAAILAGCAILCAMGPLVAADSARDLAKLALEGVTAFEKGDLDTGRAKFQKVLDADPDNIVALVNLGSLEYRAGHLEEAQKWLRQATRAKPDTFAAWLTLGVVANEAGKLDVALAALAQAVLLDPSNAKAHSYLGVVVGRKGWKDGAEAELRRALELDDTYADAHFNLAITYLQQNPPAVELARRHYRRALELGAKPDSLVEKELGNSKEAGK